MTSAPTVVARPGPKTSVAHSRFAVFRRRQQHFAMEIELVREVLPGQPLSRVARSVDEVLGVMNLRGEILPVVMVDRWLGLPPVADDPHLPILVVRRGDLLVGLRVDAIQSVANIPLPEIQPHPGAGSQTHLTGLWQPPGKPTITLISGTMLLETLSKLTSLNP
jgi:purine-binding chemotaxis protein CheW